ncbi:PP2C family protein-serine/threonine phosphatase [Marinobacter zhejiangensis]|uniref:Protein phosphatase n=1 Tax=Marinobacter zhejiangensis TaxID=488535 RepID=A0A1I4LKF2_9GAMM|nr:protein phosphatase 2C domain-containing protein [Marinobacter zhejiangensis]SFL91452.1 protein phosphatase [Marinobacter zhejiangensis]
MSLSIAGITHVGCRRSSNQDSVGWYQSSDGQRLLGVIADGMGGYQGGEIASRIAVDTLLTVLKPAVERGVADDAIADRVQAALNLANERIEQARCDRPELDKMGTTVVLAWLQRDRAWVAHIGDSRCYLLRGERLSQQTRDDTVAQNMVDDGSITREEVPRVPFRNVLTRALGVSRDAGASYSELTLAPGDRLILCSDGLSGAVADSNWPALLAGEEALEGQAQRLIDASLENQAGDNVSVMMIQFR